MMVLLTFSFFILKIGEPALPKKLFRRTLRTNSAGLEPYPPDEPRPAKARSATAGSGAAAYKYHTGNSTKTHVPRRKGAKCVLTNNA